MNKGFLILLIIALIVIGVVYWYAQQDSFFGEVSPDINTRPAETRPAALNVDDSPDTIAGELEATDIEALDKEFADIEAEIEEAF